MNVASYTLDGATYKSSVKTSGGGVGRNISEGIFKLYGRAKLISALGCDSNGDFLRKLLPTESTSSIFIDREKATANCSVILDQFGDCKLCLGDMEIHKSITPDLILQNEELIAKSPIIVFDANIPLETMEVVLDLGIKYKKPVFFEPTDMRIANKPFKLSPEKYEAIKFISPNLYELRTIAEELGVPLEIIRDSNLEDSSLNDIISEVSNISKILNKSIDNIIVTLGNKGVVLTRKSTADSIFFEKSNSSKTQTRFYKTENIEKLVNVSGAGDSFTSGFITAVLEGKPETICVSVGFAAAQIALQSHGAVPKSYFNKNNECWTKNADFIKC